MRYVFIAMVTSFLVLGSGVNENLSAQPSGEPWGAEARLESLKDELFQHQEDLAALQAKISRLEAEIVKAEKAFLLETINKAGAGDEAKMAELLDRMGPVTFAEVELGLAFKEADAKKVVKVVDRKFKAAETSVFKSKLCWVLGLNGSPEAARLLRSYIAKEKDIDVLSNALHALAQCPPSRDNLKVLDRVWPKKRPMRYFGYYPPASLAEQVAHIRAITPGGGVVPNNATVPGEIIMEDPTLISLGLEWHIEGDDNRNCKVEVAYRKKGEASWKKGLPFLRVENRANPTYKINPGNLLAGSIFNLESDTEYEVRLILFDPDGDKAQRIVTARTRSVPKAYDKGRILHIIPGAGGGTGTEKDPFKGLQAAIDAAQPGDILLLHQGIYKGRTIVKKNGTEEKPIVIRGTDVDKVILDGQGGKEVLRLSGTKHIFVERLTIRNARLGIAAYSVEGLVVRRCKIEKVGYIGITAQWESRNCYIADNVIKGPASWAKGRKDSSWGVIVNGTGHIICYNRISDFWDCISLAGKEFVTCSVDIYGNELLQGTDDGVEADYIRHNVRIFKNRLTNTFSSLSFQPVFGGPGYLLHNAMYNTTNKPYKLHVEPSGMIIAHNTSITTGRAFAGGQWRNAIFRNNIIIGTEGYAMETQAALADMDYDGWTKPSEERFIKFNLVRYPTLADFTKATGLERHGLMVSMDIFANLKLPDPAIAYEPDAQDLRLKSGSAAIDAGVVLPNINDNYRGKAPDLGCYELGEALPHYGPRPE